MFTSLANYLLGTQQPQEDGVADERLRAVDGDDGWVLVDNGDQHPVEDSDDERRDNNLEESVFESLAVSLFPHTLPTLLPAPTEYSSLSRGSSSSSLPCLSFEESWFLTPPPCFTSEGPLYMETSPLENLLIEHPSMSVYQHPSTSYPARGRGRSDSTGGSSQGSTSSSEAAPIEPQVRPARRANGVSMHNQQEKQCVQMRSAQKIRQGRASQVLKRNAMDRTNKARETHSSRNKCQRRSDRQHQRSGANNDRKCC